MITFSYYYVKHPLRVPLMDPAQSRENLAWNFEFFAFFLLLLPFLFLSFSPLCFLFLPSRLIQKYTTYFNDWDAKRLHRDFPRALIGRPRRANFLDELSTSTMPKFQFLLNCACGKVNYDTGPIRYSNDRVHKLFWIESKTNVNRNFPVSHVFKI